MSSVHDDDAYNELNNSLNLSEASTPDYSTNAGVLSADDGAAIVRNIASFLTLSDGTSMVSVVLPSTTNSHGDPEYNVADSDSWAVGEELQLEQLNTPATPAIMAISPGATPRFDYLNRAGNNNDDPTLDLECNNAIEYYVVDDEVDEIELEEVLQERKRQWVQERLAAAVFAHPCSIRSYCVEAYAAATEIRQQKELQQPPSPDPETHRDPPGGNSLAAAGARGKSILPYRHQPQQPPYRYHQHHSRHHPHHQLVGRRRRKDFAFIHELVDSILHNVPLSVLLELSSCVVDVYFESVSCTIRISANSIRGLVQALSHATWVVWDGITNFNPFAVLDAIISLQVNAMGKTSEVLASGIQSVATGVGSASSLALHRLSRTGVGNLSVNRTGSSSSSLGMGLNYHNQHFGRTPSSHLLQKKLLRKVSTINAAAEVISYMELEDESGGLSRHQKCRVQRMMHYDVSLRPFLATIAMPPNKQGQGGKKSANNNNFGNIEFAGQADTMHARHNSSTDSTNHDPNGNNNSDGNNNNDNNSNGSPSSTDSSPMDSPFMCTPQSFPPTPASRTTVLARSTRFADDVVFLARDKIRVHDALASENERTREMARALSEGKRLAVFDAKDAGSSGIELTCGQHLATKVGHMLYASTRSMVPILRNCFVYFEMTVMPRPVGNIVLQGSMVTLSIGLSTEEMPPNTLVGAWSGSVGLCTTGQILTAGQWCSPGDPALSSYGDSATVGCLVCLDDGSAFETWDGVMITAQVTFNVNGRIVTPPVSTLPTTGGASGLMPGAQMQMGLMNGSIHYDPFQHQGQNPMAYNSTLPLLVPAAEELYPTVTLHSPASAVMCRFSAEDIVASTREQIGAPEGRTIYTVDGSVITFSPGDTRE